MNRPARRTSSLSTQSPIDPPRSALSAQLPVSELPKAADRAGKQSRTEESRSKEKKTRIGPYVTDAEADRVRAAYQFGYLREENGSFTDFLSAAIMNQVVALEHRHNGGEPFSGAPARGVTKSLSQMAVEQQKRQNRAGGTEDQ